MENNANIRIVFFTSYQPKNKRERNKLDKSMRDYFGKYDLEMNFRSDIEAQIELCDNGKLCVDYDKIAIDDKNNYLKYEDSIIVNISALSVDFQNFLNLTTCVNRKNLKSPVFLLFFLQKYGFCVILYLGLINSKLRRTYVLRF